MSCGRSIVCYNVATNSNKVADAQQPRHVIRPVVRAKFFDIYRLLNYSDRKQFNQTTHSEMTRLNFVVKRQTPRRFYHEKTMLWWSKCFNFYVSPQ